MNQTLWSILNGVNSRYVGYDRRVRFRDLARIPPAERRPTTRIINFYSAVSNIGNYLPVLGIRQMLGSEPDTWNIHDRHIDFDFINRHYQCAIIGGAGLLDHGFEFFWDTFGRECRLPTVIWGVGLCAPDSALRIGVNRKVFGRAAARCALINFRDDLTANHYDVPNAVISACPTLAYLQRFGPTRPQGHVLYSSHEQIVSDDERNLIARHLRQALGHFVVTDNVQRRLRNVDDILRSCYHRSRLVVTTRLHGAIIAYGMGVPYIAIARDEKIRSFCRFYGNGILIEDSYQLAEALATQIACDRPVQYQPVCAFGTQVKGWLASLPEAHAGCPAISLES